MCITEHYTDSEKVYKLWEEDVKRLADLDDAKIDKLEERIKDLELEVEHFRREASTHLSMWVAENKKAGELSDKLNEIWDILRKDMT